MCSEVRKLGSADALAWMLEHVPPTVPERLGDAFTIMGHRSWAKRQQEQLYEAYFWRIFPSSPRPLNVFTKFMSPTSLLRRIAKTLEGMRPDDVRTLSLSRYHLHWFVGRLLPDDEETILRPLLDQLAAALDATGWPSGEKRSNAEP